MQSSRQVQEELLHFLQFAVEPASKGTQTVWKDGCFFPYSIGTSHDWRLRCGAVDLYFTLFGLSRPSCLPLPELGLVLNLKEKKAVLNPTIIPEAGASGPEPPNNPNNLGQIVGFQSTVSNFLILSQPPHDSQ